MLMAVSIESQTVEPWLPGGTQIQDPRTQQRHSSGGRVDCHQRS